MKGPDKTREIACIGAVLLSSSKEPIEYFFCSEPIDCPWKVNYANIH